MPTKFETFAALHVPGDPVILYNIWDVGSAQAVIRAGAKALATGDCERSFGICRIDLTFCADGSQRLGGRD